MDGAAALSPAQITRRLTAVEELVKKTIDREELILSLREITDFERAMTRIMTGTASCRDLAALSQGAASLPARQGAAVRHARAVFADAF